MHIENHYIVPIERGFDRPLIRRRIIDTVNASDFQEVTAGVSKQPKRALLPVRPVWIRWVARLARILCIVSMGLFLFTDFFSNFIICLVPRFCDLLFLFGNLVVQISNFLDEMPSRSANIGI